MKSSYKITRWPKLPKIRFSQALMRPLVTLDETQALSCYHIRLSRGAVMEPAYHKKAVEVIWIVKGRGEAQLGGKRVPVRAGDVLFIPPPTHHGFTTGSSLEMLAMLSPRVDSQTDFYSVAGEAHAAPHVVSGRWKEGARSGSQKPRR